jgi:hypothetical protein
VSDQCRTCRALIVWGITEKGRRIPLDAKPHPDGNIYLYHDVAYVLPVNGRSLAEHREMGTPLYVSHFATCPNAAKHRRKR